MKKKLTFICACIFSLFLNTAFCQIPSYKHPSTLGVHMVLYNFASGSPLDQIERFNPGLSLAYTKGVTNHVDLQVSLTGSFPDSTSRNSANRPQSFLLQSDLSVRFRPMNSVKFIQPFILGGFGLSNHYQNTGSYFSLGPGVEINVKGAYFYLGAQYQGALSHNLNSHYVYHLGIAGLLSRPKKQKLLSAKIDALPQDVQSDRDKDGTIDSLDNCPTVPGLPQLHGCPDTDGDGVIDTEDKCPSVFGYKKYEGCPIADKDNDGISDEEDQCPTTPGTARYKGCPIPDSDKDGVNDEEDKCVDVPGFKTNYGCPFLTNEIKAQLEKVASQIFFKTGSYVLLENSFNALDKVVAILKENRALKLSIEGHTDNVGNERTNQLLSENRAKAVVTYLIKNGIEEDRLRYFGYGMQRPIESNQTEEGRAKNRRVELKIVQ